jgi:hypothetical protein
MTTPRASRIRSWAGLLSVLINSLNMIQTLLSGISFAVRVRRAIHSSNHVYQILKPATTFSGCPKSTI